MDWSKLTSEPNDFVVRKLMLETIKSIRIPYVGSWRSFLIDNVRRRKTLDIGVVEHNINYIVNDSWLHKDICASASYCLGIDILDDMVVVLRDKGYNVKCVDATSDIFLGELFDCVNIGDVVEHVNDPVKLLSFSKRHLSEDGEIVLTTPNPFYFAYFFKVLSRSSLVVNFEHISWITPSMAIEIGRRAGLKLESIVVPHSNNLIKKFFITRFPEILRNKFIYVFKHAE